jgi:hypothetical protein
VEAPGGVRPEATSSDARAEVGLLVEAKGRGEASGVAARERFGGEHQLVSWSPGYGRETHDAGYAPLEWGTKRWPTKAQSGAWRPGCPGGSPVLLYAQRRVRPYHTPRHRSTGLTLTVSSARSGARRQGASRSARIRPLLELARAAGQTLLLTTHFSGADEGRLEASGSIIVGRVIANQGEVVRPSQLIASVRRLVARDLTTHNRDV